MHKPSKFNIFVAGWKKSFFSVSRPVWLNSWVFIYELSGCGFESRCSHLNFQSMLLLLPMLKDHHYILLFPSQIHSKLKWYFIKCNNQVFLLLNFWQQVTLMDDLQRASLAILQAVHWFLYFNSRWNYIIIIILRSWREKLPVFKILLNKAEFHRQPLYLIFPIRLKLILKHWIWWNRLKEQNPAGSCD